MMIYIHDIAHCNNEHCKDKNKCYRYNAWLEIKGTDCLVSMFKPETVTTGKCKYFMED